MLNIMKVIKQIKKRGTSYCIPVEKGLIDSGTVELGVYYMVTIEI